MTTIPLTKPAKIAYALLGVSCLSFGLILYFQQGESGWLLLVLTMLEHGFEGAMIGGICDVIAIRQVYRKAEQQYTPLIEGVSKTVVQDMLRLRELANSGDDLREWIDKPENLVWFQEQIQSQVPQKHVLERLLNDIWEQQLQTEIVRWILKSDPRDFLHSSKKQGIMDQPIIRDVLADCMDTVAENEDLALKSMNQLRKVADSMTLVDLGVPADRQELDALARLIWERWSGLGRASSIQNFLADKVIKVLVPAMSERIEKMSLKDILEPTLQKEAIQTALRRGSNRIRIKKGGDIPDELMESMLSYFDAYLEAWMLLDAAKREEAIEALVDRIKPLLFEVIIDAVWDMREAILHLENLEQHQWIKDLMMSIAQSLSENSGDIEKEAQSLLSQRLNELGAFGFRQMLQRRTQEPLDWIKVNGACWGFVLGCTAGIISYVAHHL
ncbi:MAG: hypothetical protein VX278_14670 [Myxococcota bacterium]|nr:hypothetical protein [Myxococcota bacterium]